MNVHGERFCAECFIPIDGCRPGCHACKQRALYRKRKEQRPAEHKAYIALKSAQSARRRGYPASFAWELDLHRRLLELQERRAA